MHDQPLWPERRRVLAWAGVWAAAGSMARAQAAEAPTGWLQPRPSSPPLRIIAADGRRLALSDALAGKITALQLMFTGCSSTCPIQGALFAALAGRLAAPEMQLLSISIDTLGDTPARLGAWQARFGQNPAWHAAVADVADVDHLADFMKGAAAKSGTHTAQVFVFDRQARLAYRTGDSPGIGEVEALLSRVARP